LTKGITTKNRSSSSNIKSERHKPKYDADSINRAIDKAIRNENFLNDALKSLGGLHFPAYKRDIINHVKATSIADSDIVSLFESLDGYIEFRDLYHIRKALEVNLPQKKTRYQITDKTREHPNVRTRYTSHGSKSKSTKEVEAVNEFEERKDYPEVTPTAMRDFICSMCGKSFQNQDDLVHHRNFEGSHNIRIHDDSKEVRKKNSNVDTVKARVGKPPEISTPSPKRVGDIRGEPPTNEAVNTYEASKMARILEGLTFPASKEEIKKHINRRSTSERKEIMKRILQAIQDKLMDKTRYNSTYDIEKAIGLVVKK
jgi:hypothetical protein